MYETASSACALVTEMTSTYVGDLISWWNLFWYGNSTVGGLGSTWDWTRLHNDILKPVPQTERLFSLCRLLRGGRLR